MSGPLVFHLYAQLNLKKRILNIHKNLTQRVCDRCQTSTKTEMKNSHLNTMDGACVVSLASTTQYLHILMCGMRSFKYTRWITEW